MAMFHHILAISAATATMMIRAAIIAHSAGWILFMIATPINLDSSASVTRMDRGGPGFVLENGTGEPLKVHRGLTNPSRQWVIAGEVQLNIGGL
jgi:hypothetical protein